MFIDIHCHIDLYSDKKIEKIVEDAREKSIEIIVNSGANSKANRKNLELAEKFEEVLATMGVYPIDALDMNDEEIDNEIEFIRKNKNKIIAISEIGLDFQEDTENIERQKVIFGKFISLAIELDKPMIIHSRKAESECMDILELKNAKKVIMHSFSGKFRLAKIIAENGWFLSIPASVKYNDGFKKLAKEIDIEQLLCETDSPFLHPDKKKNNEPKNVIESYKKIAELKGLSLKEVEKKIEGNYKRMFE